MTDAKRPEAAFRLNLEQQKKQAKELLKAVKAADAAALSRMAASGLDTARAQQRSEPKLAAAQLVIARELGFGSWRELKAHIASLQRAFAAIEQQPPPDAAMKTLHLRCGSDIRPTLLAAGFSGAFLEVSYPYCHGPVTAAPDHLELEAQFITQSAAPLFEVSLVDALARRREEEHGLAASAENFPRIVLWMEHDCFDQLVLLRCLAHYASTQAPRVLELISINHFPGAVRFIGLGQLPVEALRLLWERRQPVTASQLALARQAFDALRLDDPRPLAALMRTGATALPYLATALHRLLQELPAVGDGLSLTERLILQVLSAAETTFSHLFAQLTYQCDPLPFVTDLRLLEVVEGMSQLSDPVLTVSSVESRWQRRLAITPTGRAVLRGERDLLSLQPRNRWVGGVQLRATPGTWRWDEQRRDAVLK